MAKVNFRAGTLAQFNSVTSKDTNTLYFLTDAKKIYKGDVDVTSAVEIVTAFDPAEQTPGTISLANAVAGKFYVNASTFEMRVKNGSAWAIMSPGYIAAGGNWSDATDDSKLGTIGVIKTIIGQAMATISTAVSYDNSTGTLTVGSNSARLTGVINGISYDQGQLQLTVNSVSASGAPTSQIISLPKDNFVRSGRYEAEYTLPDPPGGTGPAIVLTVGDGEEEQSEIVIPAESLVDVYTGGSTQNITVSVSGSNVITASAIIDPAEGNALVSSETGLMVNISGKANTVTATDGNVILADGTGNFKDGGVTILASGAMGSSTTQIPVASVIAAAIASAVSASQGTLQTAIDALDDRVTDLETFQTSLAGKYLTSSVANNFVGFADASGNIKDSGKKAGAATLAESPDANTLATEAAVAAAVANFTWQEIS